jgi:hypothetical protein
VGGGLARSVFQGAPVTKASGMLSVSHHWITRRLQPSTSVSHSVNPPLRAGYDTYFK